ncbi:MAG: hypothetical protein ACYDBJ_21560 [Aggregatilineales bacterium]
MWNFQGSVEVFQERAAVLDELLRAEGRQPGAVTRTAFLPVMCWRDEAERDRWLNLLRRTLPYLTSASAETILAIFQEPMNAVLGSPEQVIERLNAYANAGAEEFMAWISPHDMEGLALVAEHVLPYVTQ